MKLKEKLVGKYIMWRVKMRGKSIEKKFRPLLSVISGSIEIHPMIAALFGVYSSILNTAYEMQIAKTPGESVDKYADVMQFVATAELIVQKLTEMPLMNEETAKIISTMDISHKN